MNRKTVNVARGLIACLFVVSQLAAAKGPPEGKGPKGGGGDSGGSSDYGSCADGEIGFLPSAESFRENGPDDYLIYDLTAPVTDTKWVDGVDGTNYIRNIKLHAYRPSNDGSGARNIVLGGQPSNSFPTGGEVIDYTGDGFQMQRNSKVLVTVQSDTNTSGTNISFNSNWNAEEEWLLCGTPDYSSIYKEWGTSVSSAYTGKVLNALTLGGGVNVMGGEYACAQGWGFHHHTAVGVSHDELRKMLDEWGVKTVRLPMNEHCWVSQLGAESAVYDATETRFKTESPTVEDNLDLWFDYIQQNNNSTKGRNSNKAGLEASTIEEVCDANKDNCSTQGWGYRKSFIELVEILTRERIDDEGNTFEPINVVLDLHWTDSAGDGTGKALGLTDFPGKLSELFWASVAETFDGDEKVLFNLFNEPKGIPSRDASLWLKWRDGDESNSNVGMQRLVNVVRDTANSDNDIVIGGLDYGGDLRGWLSHVPYDSKGKIWADSHSTQQVTISAMDQTARHVGTAHYCQYSMRDLA